MNTVLEAAKTIIGVSLLSGIISVIAPVGSNTRVFRFVSGLFVILCLIRPLNDLSDMLKRTKLEVENEYTFADTEDYTSELLENEMKSLVNACVKQVTGESAKDISVEINDNNGNIEISSVTVILAPEYNYKSKAVEELVFSKYGILPAVIT